MFRSFWFAKCHHHPIVAGGARWAAFKVPRGCKHLFMVPWTRTISLYTASTVMLPRQKASVTSSRSQRPSEVYLKATLDPNPSTDSTRKLLVLDLNGCLVHRGPPSTTRLDQGNHGKRKRVCYPRLYMEAFRKYIFHPETRAWLDVMVWSAAQPHNVGEMVDACFGQDRKDLVAVWARDKMELGKKDYRECFILC